MVGRPLRKATGAPGPTLFTACQHVKSSRRTQAPQLRQEPPGIEMSARLGDDPTIRRVVPERMVIR